MADSSATRRGIHGRAGLHHTDVRSQASLASSIQPRNRAELGWLGCGGAEVAEAEPRAVPRTGESGRAEEELGGPAAAPSQASGSQGSV